MSAPDPQPGVWQLAEWLGGLALAACTGLFKLISSKASKEELAAVVRRSDEQFATTRDDIGRMFEELKADRDEASTARHDMRDKMQSIALTVARLEGKIDNGGHL